MPYKNVFIKAHFFDIIYMWCKMKYYLYDFDGTIYDGDSSVDFFKFCLKKDKSIYKMLPKMFIKFIAYK